ncbi:MAG: LolA family protein [Bacteroidota bacterium]
MKKYAFLMMAFAVITFLAQAQNNPETAAEQQGKKLLQEASDKIKGYSSMEVEFTYTMENTEMDITETMEGKIYSSGDKYRMVMGENVFISDGETVWNFIDELYEIQINTVENSEGGLTPTALLENFEQEYRAKFIRQENHEGTMVDIIDLVPNTPQSFFKYRVALNAQDHSLVYTIAYDRHGGTYTYSIDSLKPNASIPDSMFVFNREDFPADADVIDLR